VLVCKDVLGDDEPRRAPPPTSRGDGGDRIEDERNRLAEALAKVSVRKWRPCDAQV